MIEFENYKNNLDFIDKHGIKDVEVTKSVVYNGPIEIINKTKTLLKSDQNQPLAAAIVGLDNTAAPLPTNPDFYDVWTDIDAQELFVNSKPTCYLILGKPGSGAYSLGEAMSKKLSCVHLCPKNIIMDEIEQQTPTGICINFNIKHNKAITFDTLLKILTIKLNSPAVKHRGYVLSGFPLVTSSRSSKYLINTLNGEEAIICMDEMLFDVICNMKKKKPKVPKDQTGTPRSSITSDAEVPVEEGAEEEEEQEPEELPEEEEELKVELPKFLLDTCTDIIFPIKAYYNSKKAVLLQQLNALFTLEIKPDIIIYMTCPDKDLVTKKLHKYLNYKNNHYIHEPFIANTSLDVRWPTKYTTKDNFGPIDNHIFNQKYSCRQPINFEHKSIEQMCNYRHNIFQFIEDKIKDFDPKYVIKLDARQTLHDMMHNISERLLMIPTVPVLIPEPLYMEEPPEDMEEFWKSLEELNVIRSGVIAFKRYASLWFDRCPVELKKRQSVRGNPKLAVLFSKHVYLTASLDNMISFCRNPRPYLKLKYLEPTCRIIVIGTKSSGKTMISEYLSWLFDTPVTNYNSFLNIEKQKKYDTFAKTILSEIIATIEDTRFANWQKAELERFSNLNAWCKLTKMKLKKYIPLLLQYIKYTTPKDEIYEGEMEETPSVPLEFLNDFNTFRNDLLFLPFLDSIDECENALSDKVIVQYAPADFKTPIEKPTLPVLGDKDVMLAIAAYIVANELQKDIEPTVEELIDEMTKIITTIDTERQESTDCDEMYGTFIIDGFPSDPEYWGLLSESKLLPDYTVALIENREIDSDLIEYYKGIDKCMKNHYKKFSLINDPLIKTKIKTKQMPDSIAADMKIIVHQFTEKIMDDYIVAEKPQVNLDTDPWASFTENIEKFKEDWESIKSKLEEYNKCFIDVELENKSDVHVVEEVLLKLRKSYFIGCEVNEDEEVDDQDDENEVPKDMLTYNSPQSYGETGSYCPVSFYDYGVLWEGKPELSVRFNNKLHRFCKEECSELFQKDVTKYQYYNKPFKALPPLRICVIGCIGSGKTTISKILAKELGLIHADFSEVINDILIPKHFKKVGRNYENTFTDVPINEEAVVEFQMDEANVNLISDILSNETELRRMVFNYFESGAPLLPPLMQKVITKLWFQDPFVNTGFILDGYPRLPTDIEDMMACFCIPDLIIDIGGSSESSLQRLSPKMLKIWKLQLNEAKEKSKQKLDKEKKEWMNFITKTIVIKLICDEIIENMFFSSAEPVKKGLSTESVIIDAHPSGSVIDANLFNVYNETIQDFPEPVDQSEWPKQDEVREGIDARIESIYEIDDENIQTLKDLLSEQKIKTASIDGTKSLIKVTRIALSKLTNLRNRCESLFEQTIIMNSDIAELLLLEGFCFLSKFNRMCPVYIYENPQAILNIYKLHRRKSNVFPVIHRAYIYFICGEESVKKFRTNPLKYVTSRNISLYKEYPLRISVIGAPKSGKSSLSAKLAKRFGLVCLSKGIAVRDFIENMHWTELGNKMTSFLNAGECINSDLIMKAVQTLAMDHRTITNGFVLDGFPESASEAMELCRDALYPNIVFDISADLETVTESSQNEVYFDLLKRKPPYSRPFIENRYIKWQDKKYSVRDWIYNDYQNIYVLNGNKSRWQCSQDAINIINAFIPKVHYYLLNVQTKVVPAHAMCISNETFMQRMSNLKNMCPICFSKNIFRNNGYPVDKKGVLQYRNKFYWVCEDHMSMVLKHPHCFLTLKKVHIPELPAVVKTVDMSLVYENGICIVTYAENLPAQKVLRGSNKFAANFRGKIYMFCSELCLEKFLKKPHIFSDITVFKESKIFPPISLKKLPNIGYLEQTVGNVITEACCSVNVLRPKYPGLDFPLSGLLHIALYLKTHNPLIDKSALQRYSKALQVYEARCRLLMRVALFLRSMDNPFANYPKCCSDANKYDFGTVRKPTSLTSSTKHSVTVSEVSK